MELLIVGFPVSIKSMSMFPVEFQGVIRPLLQNAILFLSPLQEEIAMVAWIPMTFSKLIHPKLMYLQH